MTDSYAALSGFQHICRSFWLVCSVEYSVHVSFCTLLFPALQVNGPLRHVLLFHADHSAAEKPSARISQRDGHGRAAQCRGQPTLNDRH
jgi:hypothetical protein